MHAFKDSVKKGTIGGALGGGLIPGGGLKYIGQGMGKLNKLQEDIQGTREVYKAGKKFVAAKGLRDKFNASNNSLQNQRATSRTGSSQSGQSQPQQPSITSDGGDANGESEFLEDDELDI
jgi:hypothetical protein